jgi:protein SHQ1
VPRAQKRRALFGLVDILYGFAFDERCTMCEGNCESGWAMTKLSATLSWLDTQPSVEDAVYVSIRRALSFPLFRSWALACKVVDNMRAILLLARFGVVV